MITIKCKSKVAEQLLMNELKYNKNIEVSIVTETVVKQIVKDKLLKESDHRSWDDVTEEGVADDIHYRSAFEKFVNTNNVFADVKKFIEGVDQDFSSGGGHGNVHEYEGEIIFELSAKADIVALITAFNNIKLPELDTALNKDSRVDANFVDKWECELEIATLNYEKDDNCLVLPITVTVTFDEKDEDEDENEED